MGYQRTKGHGKGTFVMVRHDIMKSPAGRSLSSNARCVWREIMFRYKGDNNGDIPLSCRETAELLGIGKSTAYRAFAELEDLVIPSIYFISKPILINADGLRCWEYVFEHCVIQPKWLNLTGLSMGL